MDVLAAAVILALVAGTLLLLSGPLRRAGGAGRAERAGGAGRGRGPGSAPGEGGASSGEAAALEAAKEDKYREIRETELDFRTGKLSEEDFRAVDRALRAEAAELLRRLDALDR